jgi:hypothetical protein
MTRNSFLNVFVAVLALPVLYLADVTPGTAPGLTLVRQAQAIVGAPLTPVSFAGVARRTTARAVTATAAAQATAADPAEQQAVAAARPAGAPAIGTVVSTLPEGCEPEIRDGIEYQNCGGVYYRSAFQGNNLVYVVQ